MVGYTGTGKTFLACSIGRQACKHCLSTLYVRMPDLLMSREEDLAAGIPESKVLKKYARYKVLVVVSSNLSRYHRSPGLVPAISKRRYRE